MVHRPLTTSTSCYPLHFVHQERARSLCQLVPTGYTSKQSRAEHQPNPATTNCITTSRKTHRASCLQSAPIRMCPRLQHPKEQQILRSRSTSRRAVGSFVVLPKYAKGGAEEDLGVRSESERHNEVLRGLLAEMEQIFFQTHFEEDRGPRYE